MRVFAMTGGMGITLVFPPRDNWPKIIWPKKRIWPKKNRLCINIAHYYRGRGESYLNFLHHKPAACWPQWQIRFQTLKRL